MACFLHKPGLRNTLSKEHCAAERPSPTPHPGYTIELAAEAIRGHRSAHSLATGPVMAEPAAAPHACQPYIQACQLQGQGVPAARALAATQYTTNDNAPFISPLGLTMTPALSSK